MTGYKIFTHDFRSPIQGTATGWDGTAPFALAPVALDKGPAECAAGWNFCAILPTALRIAGLWPDGWPCVAVEVEPGADAITRDDKSRASSLTIVRICDVVEVHQAIRTLSARWFGDYFDAMAREQIAWYEALGRHGAHDEGAVAEGLEAALKARNLAWKLQQYGDARDAWAARAAWAAWAAWAALTHYYASLRGWVESIPSAEKYTVGIRDAYAHGLGVATPVAPDTLGWAMVEAGS